MWVLELEELTRSVSLPDVVKMLETWYNVCAPHLSMTYSACCVIGCDNNNKCKKLVSLKHGVRAINQT